MKAAIIAVGGLACLIALIAIVWLAVASLGRWRRSRVDRRWAKARREARWEDEVRTKHGMTGVFIRRVAKVGHAVKVVPNTETQVGDDVHEFDPDWDQKVRALRAEARVRIIALNTET